MSLNAFGFAPQEPERLVGCTGAPAESHELLWFNLTREKNRRCPECGSGMSTCPLARTHLLTLGSSSPVYALDFQGSEHAHEHHH